ncbi:MAG: chloride channel protein [Promethearchaeota archaeon]
MVFERIENLIKSENAKNGLKWISLAILIGLIIGLIAIIFEIILIFLIGWTNSLSIWIIIFLPIIGLLMSGLITSVLAPEARGHGTDAIIHAYHHNWGLVQPRVIGAKLSASIATLGFGGSAGRSGPTFQMGGGVSSLIGKNLKFSLKARKILVLCGMSASFGAIFAAPLSGAVFACEVVFRDDFEYTDILPCVISSVVGYLTYQGIFSVFFGHIEQLIQIPNIDYTFIWPHISIFIGLGLICGLIGLLYVKSFYFIDRKVEAWNKPEWFKTLLGGIVVSFLALLFIIFALNFTGDISNTTLILGLGWNLINILGNNPLFFSLQFLILLLIFKILTTCFTIGSGGSGGVVAPSLVIGGVIGGIIAILLSPILSFDLRVIIGVSTIVMFMSIAHIPITGMLMAGEIYGIPFIIPTLLAGVIGSWVATGDSIYHSSLISKTETLTIYKKYKVIT